MPKLKTENFENWQLFNGRSNFPSTCLFQSGPSPLPPHTPHARLGKQRAGKSSTSHHHFIACRAVPLTLGERNQFSIASECPAPRNAHAPHAQPLRPARLGAPTAATLSTTWNATSMRSNTALRTSWARVGAQNELLSYSPRRGVHTARHGRAECLVPDGPVAWRVNLVGGNKSDLRVSKSTKVRRKSRVEACAKQRLTFKKFATFGQQNVCSPLKRTSASKSATQIFELRGTVKAHKT